MKTTNSQQQNQFPGVSRQSARVPPAPLPQVDAEQLGHSGALGFLRQQKPRGRAPGTGLFVESPALRRAPLVVRPVGATRSLVPPPSWSRGPGHRPHGPGSGGVARSPRGAPTPRRPTPRFKGVGFSWGRGQLSPPPSPPPALTALRSRTPSLASCSSDTNLVVSSPRLFSCLLLPPPPPPSCGGGGCCGGCAWEGCGCGRWPWRWPWPCPCGACWPELAGSAAAIASPRRGGAAARPSPPAATCRARCAAAAPAAAGREQGGGARAPANNRCARGAHRTRGGWRAGPPPPPQAPGSVNGAHDRGEGEWKRREGAARGGDTSLNGRK